MFKQFLKDEKGQSTVEYLLILAVIVLVISALGNKMKPLIEGVTENVFGQINAKIKQLAQ